MDQGEIRDPDTGTLYKLINGTVFEMWDENVSVETFPVCEYCGVEVKAGATECRDCGAGDEWPGSWRDVFGRWKDF